MKTVSFFALWPLVAVLLIGCGPQPPAPVALTQGERVTRILSDFHDINETTVHETSDRISFSDYSLLVREKGGDAEKNLDSLPESATKRMLKLCLNSFQDTSLYWAHSRTATKASEVMNITGAHNAPTAYNVAVVDGGADGKGWTGADEAFMLRRLWSYDAQMLDIVTAEINKSQNK